MSKNQRNKVLGQDKNMPDPKLSAAGGVHKRTRSRLFDDSLTTVEKEIPKSKLRKTTKNKTVKASKIKPNNAEKAKNNNAVPDPVQKNPTKGGKSKTTHIAS